LKYKLISCFLAGLTVAGLIVPLGCSDGRTTKLPSPSELAEQGYASPDFPRITAEDLKVMYDNRDPFILVDTRPRFEYLDGYIPGARNIPNNPPEESLKELSKLPKDRLIITYCDCLDDGEAARAAEMLRFMDYPDVKILWKGIDYWADIGGEVRT